MNNISIATSQNVVIDYEAAGVGDRILASLIDSLVIVAYLFVVFISFFLIMGAAEIGDELSGLMIAIGSLLYLPILFYHLLCEIFMNGQSFGKKAMKIKVVKLDGGNPTVSSYFLRWILRLVDFTLSYSVVGLILIIATEKSQRLGDLAAGTTVVRLTRKVNLKDTIYEKVVEETHVVTYPQVEQLTDNDISVLKEVVNAARLADNPQLLNQLYVKMQQTLNVEHNGSAAEFLHTVVKDYNYITGQ